MPLGTGRDLLGPPLPSAPTWGHPPLQPSSCAVNSGCSSWNPRRGGPAVSLTRALWRKEPQGGKSLTVHSPWTVKERDGEAKHGLSPQGTPPKWRNEAALHAQM